MSDEPTPGSLFEEATDDVADAVENHAAAEGEHVDQGATVGRPNVTDVLMETKPNLSPDDEGEKFGLSPAGANAYVGARKAMNAVMKARGMDMGEVDGTPALVNFGMAVFHKVIGSSDPVDDDGRRDHDPDESDTVDADPMDQVKAMEAA